MNPPPLTYDLGFRHGDRPAIRCLLCDAISWHPGDVANRYCARCHLFHDAIEEGRRLLASGGGHECAAWRTGRDHCALCGRVVPAPTDRP